jgi:hypothetical protein
MSRSVITPSLQFFDLPITLTHSNLARHHPHLPKTHCLSAMTSLSSARSLFCRPSTLAAQSSMSFRSHHHVHSRHSNLAIVIRPIAPSCHQPRTVTTSPYIIPITSAPLCHCCPCKTSFFLPDHTLFLKCTRSKLQPRPSWSTLPGLTITSAPTGYKES